MATNPALDQDWLDHAFRVRGEPTQKAAVTRDQQDHIAAADSLNLCRRRGIQIGSIDALLIQLGQRDELNLLTTDKDVRNASRTVTSGLWSPA